MMNVELIKIDEIKPYDHNPRDNEQSIPFLMNSIKEFGFKVPIVVDSDKVIVAGHTRYEACKRLGMEEIPCVIADDLTPEQVKAFRIADNKVTERSTWNYEFLKDELKEISDFDFNMTDFGFADFELGALIDTDSQTESYFDDGLVDKYSVDEEELLVDKRIIISYKTGDEEEFLKQCLGLSALPVNLKCANLMAVNGDE